MFVDIHHHLIYGLDDGPQTLVQTKKMVVAAYRGGVSHIVATPHATPGRRPFEYETFLARIQEVRSWCSEKNIKLQIDPGCEILYTEDTARMVREGRIPTLAGSHVVLVEFLPNAPYSMLKGAARVLGGEGYDVLFAHIERYACLRKRKNLLELRNEHQVLMQMNAGTIIHTRGFFEKRWVNSVLKHRLIDVVASDSHNVTSRRCRMLTCYRMLREQYGRAYANALCITNPLSLIEDERYNAFDSAE